MANINAFLERVVSYPITIINLEKGWLFNENLCKTLQANGFGSDYSILLSVDEEYNNFSLYWRWTEDQRFGGEINVKDLFGVFEYGWTNTLWFNKLSSSPSEEIKKFDAFSRNLYGFDAMEESMDNTRVAAFYVDKEKLDKTKPLNPDIWLFNADDPKYLLSLNFQQYLEKLTVTKGFFGWQTFFLDWDRMDFNDPMIREVVFPYAPATSEMEEFLEIMPKIFPDQDYTEYHQLYADWKAKAKQYGF